MLVEDIESQLQIDLRDPSYNYLVESALKTKSKIVIGDLDLLAFWLCQVKFR